jgi:hypothetical protein
MTTRHGTQWYWESGLGNPRNSILFSNNEVKFACKICDVGHFMPINNERMQTHCQTAMHTFGVRNQNATTLDFWLTLDNSADHVAFNLDLTTFVCKLCNDGVFYPNNLRVMNGHIRSQAHGRAKALRFVGTVAHAQKQTRVKKTRDDFETFWEENLENPKGSLKWVDDAHYKCGVCGPGDSPKNATADSMMSHCRSNTHQRKMQGMMTTNLLLISPSRKRGREEEEEVLPAPKEKEELFPPKEKEEEEELPPKEKEEEDDYYVSLPMTEEEEVYQPPSPPPPPEEEAMATEEEEEVSPPPIEVFALRDVSSPLAATNTSMPAQNVSSAAAEEEEVCIQPSPSIDIFEQSVEVFEHPPPPPAAAEEPSDALGLPMSSPPQSLSPIEVFAPRDVSLPNTSMPAQNVSSGVTGVVAKGWAFAAFSRASERVLEKLRPQIAQNCAKILSK